MPDVGFEFTEVGHGSKTEVGSLEEHIPFRTWEWPLALRSGMTVRVPSSFCPTGNSAKPVNPTH